MILLSELSRRRIRSVNKLIRVGKQEVCMVLRVDKEKGYIDLSKRRVSAEDVAKCDERFNKSKAVHSIMRHISEVKSVDMEALYSQTAWPLYAKFKHAYDAFRADIGVTCFHYEGINAIRSALLKGAELAAPEHNEGRDLGMKVKLVAPPLYVMTCSAYDKTHGIKLLNDAIAVMTTEIRAAKGELQVKVAARAVDERDDKALSALMSTLDAQNQEVDGDADEEDVEGMGSVNLEGV